jgi:phenylacetate-coenzyme A ligase PaaK-like adenylate-forming protein
MRRPSTFNPPQLPDLLRRLARDGVRPKHSVVALVYDGQEGLTSADRELFWRSFGVPVFEELLGAGNELIAMECDAHDGLHLVGDFKDLKGGTGTCPCGNPAPRMARYRRIEELVELLV